MTRMWPLWLNCLARQSENKYPNKNKGAYNVAIKNEELYVDSVVPMIATAIEIKTAKEILSPINETNCPKVRK